MLIFHLYLCDCPLVTVSPLHVLLESILIFEGGFALAAPQVLFAVSQDMLLEVVTLKKPPTTDLKYPNENIYI